jgi:hypothetical protein
MDFKTDGAFDRAWKLSCNKHNTKRLFFKECPQCVLEAKRDSLLASVFYVKSCILEEEIMESIKECDALINRINLEFQKDDTEGAK